MLNAEKIALELSEALPGGASLKALSQMTALTGLAIVGAKAISKDPEDLAAAAVGVLKEACVRVDGARDGAVATLLGLATGTRGISISERRRQAAELLTISAERVRKDREGKLVLQLSEELIVADRTFQARRNQADQQPDALNSRLNINWLERHEAYRRIWSPVAALRADLLVLLGYLGTNREAGIALEQTNTESPAPWADLADRGLNLMWRRAQFTQAVVDFIADFGGLWLLSDPGQESKAAEAIHQLDHNGPCGDADDSWLRLQLANAERGELDAFIDLTYDSQLGKDMLETFLRWADQCRCKLDSGAAPKAGCEVHGWLAACDQYITLIDEDWGEVADWYRERNESSTTE